MFRSLFRALFIYGMMAFLVACSSLPIGEYSLEAYKNATTLKAETLALVSKSNQTFAANATAVEALAVRIDAAYEFAAGSSRNQLSANQWSLMRDPDGGLYGTFVQFWKKRGRLSTAFRDEYSGQISAAFDEIICLEANKQAPTVCKS